ncbi:unnamed protein product [Musa textilis]
MASSEKVPMHDKKEKHCFQRKTTHEQADGMPSLSRFTCSFKCMEFGAFTDSMSPSPSALEWDHFVDLPALLAKEVGRI